MVVHWGNFIVWWANVKKCLYVVETCCSSIIFYSEYKYNRSTQNKGSFRFLWPCIVNIRWRERTNKMQLIRCLFSNFLSQHVLGITMPIIRRIRPCPTECGVLSGCVGCGWLWSCGAASWAVCSVWKLLFDSNFHTVHTAYDPAPQDHSLHTQAEQHMQ